MVNILKILFGIIFLIFIFYVILTDFNLLNTKVDKTKDESLTKNTQFFEEEPYLSKVIYDDIELRALAASITKDCNLNNKECQLNSIYRHVVNNFNYYSDPENNEVIQSPKETIKIKGGDCEDLSILTNSLLENLNFSTYLVFTKEHVYSLACNIDTDKLWSYVEEDIIDTASEELKKDGSYDVKIKDGKLFLVEEKIESMNLDSRSGYYYGGDGSNLAQPIELMNIEYNIKSSEPLDVYVLESGVEFEKLMKGKSFYSYSDCGKENVREAKDYCSNLDKWAGVALINRKDEAKVDIKLAFYFEYSNNELLKDTEISAYKINENTCVVLDATAGKYGYPGYDIKVEGEKIAIDPVTKERYQLN